MRIFITFKAVFKIFGQMVPGSMGMSDAERVYDSGVRHRRRGRLR